MTTPDEAVNLEAAVERLTKETERAAFTVYLPKEHSQAILSALSASNARAVAAEEALRWIAAQKQTCGSDEVEVWELQDRARTTLASMKEKERG